MEVVDIEDFDSEFNSSQETLHLGAMTGFSFAAAASSPRGPVVRSPPSSPLQRGVQPEYARGAETFQNYQEKHSYGEPVATDPYSHDLCMTS